MGGMTLSANRADWRSRGVGLTRLCLSEGRNDMVRYAREEMEGYDAQRRGRVRA